VSPVRENPFQGFNFLVSISGEDPETPAAGFAEVTGLGVEVEYVEYRSGNERTLAPRRMPGLHRVSDVTLRRGLIGSTSLFDWIKAATTGAPSRRDVAITLLDESRSPVVAWRLRDAQPKKWSGPSLRAKSSGEVAVEELVLVAEGLDMESV
jgi:phage tail-like protein